MLKNPLPAGKRGPCFAGWYFKHQTKTGRALALIPAMHVDAAGRRSASLQVIAEGQSWWLEYPASKFHAAEKPLQIRLGQNAFSRAGIQLDIEQEGLSLHGALRYGPFTPLKSDIMGPFRFLPGMECSHGVFSMGHTLEGSMTLNGEKLDFSGGLGYIESDRGRSFPSAYLWTQCVWPGGSLMLSIADIPLPVGRFTGCICVVICRGREYQLATYRGVRIEQWSDTGAVIRQGKYRLTAELLEGQACPLRAPSAGRMDRTIRESLCAKMRYCFWSGETLLFAHTDENASFEYADKREAFQR